MSHKLNSKQVIAISKILKQNNVDFMLHYPIPENHHFVYHSTGKKNSDFYNRIEIYKTFAKPMFLSEQSFGEACQFIAIIKKDVALFNHISKKFTDVKVIRATSPLDHESIWIEIFPTSVSKGKSAQWLCNYLNIDKKNSIGIGNDYNDIDLLDFTDKSYIVENAPKELKLKYINCEHHNNNAFSEAAKFFL